MKKIQSIRGMNDLLPVDSPRWQYLESSVSSILTSYCFKEIRFPLLESTDLFKRTIGEITDIVEKEMYTFDDRNGDSLTLRPEGTAGCVRACQQSGLIFNQTQRLWYQGPMFRHERPQKGRLRQFQQIGVEVFGLNGPDIDAELIQLVSEIWNSLGLTDHLSLQINTLGSIESRNRYRKDLIAYLDEKKHDLDEDSQRRIHTNPMRILDSKDSDTQKLLNSSPDFHDYLDEESREHFEHLCNFLDKLDIAYHINKRLVRGLDYYGKTVFEWVTTMLGAQGTVCAGGRYDKLVEQMGGKSTPAVGLAMGVERLILLLDEADLFPDSIAKHIDIYVIMDSDVSLKALELSSYIRESCPFLRLQSHCGGGSLKNKIKKADKSGAQLALIISDEEVIVDNITIKFLRQDCPQMTVNKEELVKLINNKDINLNIN
ncbi:MAG: histidine--tRNA ligase [Porticoccus sp.]|jgi:histidyl-tRNA synthetase|nr:histidine--tRNA ligase [Porticoccus sp.]|tara:strand:+ start:1535 stop:2824 length:1290 start_codon:yes stop_codon:yes gene_type:complete